MLVGEWGADDRLAVRLTQARTGELFAKVAFTGPIPFQGSAQITYNGATGRFTLFVLSAKLVVKFEGALIPDPELPVFSGSLHSYTRNGAFKGQFTLQKTQLPA